jgi:hypothetical protein
MMELFGFESPWIGIAIVLSLSGVISYGIVEIIKRFVAAYLAKTPENDHEPWWWNVGLRALAVVLGGLVGGILSFAGASPLLAVSIGVAGGVLNTTIVRVVRKKLREIPVGNATEGSNDDTIPPASRGE